MQVVNSSRCRICGQAANVAALEQAASPPGMACIDKQGCENRLISTLRREEEKDTRNARDKA